MLASGSPFLGGLLGLFPSALMLLSSFLPICMDISPLLEASIQNVAAGMILGAVGMEFFPVIKQSTGNGNLGAVSVGFFVSLMALLGVELIVEYLSTIPSPISPHEASGHSASESSPLKTHGHTEWEDDGIRYASTALYSNSHQRNIRARLEEMHEYVQAVTGRCAIFLEDSSPLPLSVSEEAFERIDEALHMLDYKIDHAMRLLQGSEFADHLLQSSSYKNRTTQKNENYPSIMMRMQPRFEDRHEVEKICATLDESVQHILGHAKNDISPEELTELYGHLDDLKAIVDNLHDHVESASRKWCRSKPFPDTEPGDFVSISLVLPVCIDSMVDGFIIGIAASTSASAGIIMAVVNSMEMSFLGMAYAPRVFECTGSSLLLRYASVFLPPLVMATCSVAGGFLGNKASSDHETLFVAFNTFSAVALLMLACNVLLIEARNTHDQLSLPSWWSPITLVFVGIYFVVISDFLGSLFNY